VGLPYAEADCAELARRVRLEVFGQAVPLPAERAAGLRGLSRQIEDLKADYGTPTTAPADGDAVLMYTRGRLRHVGLYCLIGGVAWVLHALRGAGETRRHRLRELPGYGIQVEGFYRWRG
jgi:hypothetical protein